MPTTRIKNAAYRCMLPFCAPSCGPSPVSSVDGRSLVFRKHFERLLHRHHVLGSAVLLRSGPESSLVCTASASPAHNASPDTYFRVASITKMTTAVLASRLFDLQVLDPDRPVSDYFSSSGMGSALEGITLRHLLSHTSGLIDPPGLESSLEKGVPFPDILPNARREAPGTSFCYSNLGFGLIGSVMEAVTGSPVGAVFSDFLFRPLGMNATLEGCRLPAGQIMPVTRILPYHRGSDLVLTPLGTVPLDTADPLRHYGHTAGSMYTDIASLQVLLDVLVNHGSGFLSEERASDMCAQHASYGALSPALSYGYGLLRISDPSISGSLILGHQGFAYGCADGAFWEADTGRSVIMLNGGASEARTGRLGLLNRDLLRWAFRKELPAW